MFSFAAHATPQADVVDTDLAALIADATQTPERFAVDVAHAVSTDTKGEWTSDGASATWRYSVRIPSALSLSFHATRFVLPASATLAVKSIDAIDVYRAADLHGATLWSRISKGDTLDFELVVAAADRAQVALDIASFQVGFRDLNSSRWKAQALAGTANSNCVQNYACNITANNAGPGRASVAVFVRNIGACSGTLLNNARGDNTPYILTARHCQNRTIGGAPPAAPEDISVYWNALTPCGQALNSVYSSTAVVQTGLTTVVEQEDLWLLLLDQSPLVSDAYFAGFDATGASVIGGYTVHHGVSRTKQLVSWFGQAFIDAGKFSSLGNRYTSHFWETVNARGNIGPGASGSALFDQNDRVVGALSLGSTTTDDSGWDQCPAASPLAPNGHNALGYFTELAAAWNSTADTTSSTGTRTLKSVLDPDNSGVLIVDGVAASQGLTFTGSAHSLQISSTLSLDWNAPGATSCTASGGAAGDGWSGALDARGHRQIRESAEGAVTYMIACALAGGRIANARVVVTWILPPPTASLMADRFEAWTTRPVTLTWSSNQSPCWIAGGSTSLRNLASSGTVTVTETVPTKVMYTLSCGSGSRLAQAMQGEVSFTAVGIEFAQKASERRLGMFNTLWWHTGAETCTSSGGAPNDGWAGRQRDANATFLAIGATPGAFTYTLTCTSGALAARASVTFTVSDSPPYATLTASATTVDAGQDVTVSWKSNISSCSPEYDEHIAITPVTGTADEGTGSLRFSDAGTHVLKLRCPGTPPLESTPVTLTVLSAPSVVVSTGPAPSSSSTSEGGAGGGGALNWVSLLGLALFALHRLTRGRARDYSTTSL